MSLSKHRRRQSYTRVYHFDGKLLGASDLEAEQSYYTKKRGRSPLTVRQKKELCALARRSLRRRLSSGTGFVGLFVGRSSTVKTLAAKVVALELRRNLYKIDFSQVVSKYIGETEKNLDRLFEEAHRSDAVLFFDEADALFGKRSEVRDSHDRYANIDIAYLLQRMEKYKGIVILASNSKVNLDSPLMPCLSFSVDFLSPYRRTRLRISAKRAYV